MTADFRMAQRLVTPQIPESLKPFAVQCHGKVVQTSILERTEKRSRCWKVVNRSNSTLNRECLLR